jgi:lysine 6-dehydrogenase
LVGGLPLQRELPFEYKAPFSPADVIEEYTRPVRFIINGKEVVKAALDEIEKVNFEGVGELEAFATDGLRTLTTTLAGISNMKEKTLRYPGHAAIMKIFRETGLFQKKSLSIDGHEVIPLHFISKLLFPQWKFKPGEEDFTAMRVTLEGEKKEIVYTLLDRYDKKNSTSSMARTTGYTCTALASLILENNFSEKGVFAPEQIGFDEGHFNFIIKYLADRKVRLNKKVTLKNKVLTIKEG